MSVVQIVGIGLACAIGCLLLRPSRPELALVLAIAGGIVILSAIVARLGEVFLQVGQIVSMTGLDRTVFASVVKMIGLGYVCEFGAGLCEDSGYKSLGDKIILAGKLTVLSVSLPVIAQLVGLLSQVL